MKNSGFFKNYGLLFGAALPFLSIALCYTVWTGIVCNGLSLEWNAAILVIIAGSSFLLVKKLRYTRPWLLFAFCIVSVFGVVNCILSLFIDWANRSPELDNDAKAISWLLMLPAMWIILIIWGWLFDRIKNRSSATGEPIAE